MNKQFDISVIGLGKLGACTLASFASRKFSVIGYDKDNNKSQALKVYKDIYKENGLSKLLKDNKDNIHITLDLKEIFTNSKITFIVLPTPSKKDGTFSLNFLKNFFSEIVKFRNLIKTNKHRFIIVSTTNPFSINNELVPLIEKKLKLKEGLHFNIIYNPEFIALGSVLSDMKYPEFVLVGTNKNSEKKIMLKIYNKFLVNKKIKINFMNIESAELTKLAFNAYVTMKLSFSNLIGIAGLKNNKIWSKKITSTLGQSSRISPKYFKPGMPFCGPCFPRDNLSFQKFFLNKLGLKSPLSKATDEINLQIKKEHIKQINKLVIANKKIKEMVIIGSSFKENTPVITSSLSLEIIKKFKNRLNIHIYDPIDQIYLKEKEKNLIYINKININYLFNKIIIICHENYSIVNKIKKNKKLLYYNCWI